MTDMQRKYEVTVSIDSDTKTLVNEFWRDEEGRLDRLIGPAHKVFNRVSGIRQKAAYYALGRLHRDEEEGPALQEWDEQGRLLLEAFYYYGDLHRSDRKPAQIRYNPETGAVLEQKFFILGNEINPRTWKSLESERTGYPDWYPI